MTIRRRLMLSFGGMLLVSLGLLAVVLHHEWVEQQRRMALERKPPEPAWQEVGEILLCYGVPSAVILLAGAWFLLGRSLAPVTALTRAAERLQLDNLRERLPPTGTGDELDRLTDVFNRMTARLEDSYGRVREFTLHASHELKTPLTVMRAALESALREGECNPAQTELLASQLDEIHRLAKIVDGLTLLAKADAGQLVLNLQPIRLDELVQDSFADARMLAGPRRITVELTGCDAITVEGDRHRLRQLLLNLTDNAIKHNRNAGQVSMALQAKGSSAELVITNTGPGIPADKLPRVFDRFYRCDPAHNSEVEGCGLGLSIAQWVVRAHRGQINIVSEVDGLTSLTVTLPLMPPTATAVTSLPRT